MFSRSEANATLPSDANGVVSGAKIPERFIDRILYELEISFEIVLRVPCLEPAAHDYLLLRVERHRVLAVRMEITEKGIFPTGEWEECHGRGHSDVYTHHADLDARGIFAR